MIRNFKFIWLTLPVLLFWASTATAGNITNLSVTADPTIVDIYPLNLGTSTSTTISTSTFNDSDTTKTANDFYVTIKVRKPNNVDEITLVNFKKNGQQGDYYPYGALSITGGGGSYSLSYTWDTYGTETPGLYDISVYIFDGTAGSLGAENGFSLNPDEIELSTSGIPGFPVSAPSLGAVSVTAPADAIIQNPGAETGTITTSFTDVDGHASSSFLVTIKAREPDGKTERTLVSGYSGITTGEGGALSITGPTGCATLCSYTLSFSGWNPSDVGSYPNGYNDIQILVQDPDGISTMSDYATNSNKFAITSSGGPPSDTVEPIISSVTASPSSVLANSATTVNLAATITDNGGETASFTQHFFKLRHQSGAVYGPFTGTISGSYTDTYSLNATGLPTGWYDIYYEIKDTTDGYGAVSGFDNNRERLYIYPSVTISSVAVSASIVDRQPYNTGGIYPISTTITSTLNSPSAATDFYVTIKVRNPDNSTVQSLVSSKKNGEGGVSITGSAPNYTISYTWTPVSTDPEGLYDISISVFDAAQNSTGESGFNDNPDKVQVIADPTMPWPPYELNSAPSMSSASAGNVCVGIGCSFATSVSLSAEFTDVEAEAASSYKASVSIRSPDNSSEYVLMTDQTTGSTTCNTTYTDSCSLTVTNLGSGRYRADLVWDPKDSFFDSTKYGYYDVKMVVKDSYSSGGESSYNTNENILSITSSDFPPLPNAQPVITSVYATPNSVQLETAQQVTFKAVFTDDDNPSDTGRYSGAFKVRGPDGSITSACTPASTDFTNTGSGAFSTSCTWTPPGTLIAGYYDIQFSLTDNGTSGDAADDVMVVNSYDSNTDELQFIAATNLTPNPPSAGNMSQILGAALTSITVGGWTRENPTTVIFRATNVTDQNSVDDLYLEVEVEPVNTAFDNNDGADGSDTATSGIICTPSFPVHYVAPTAVTLEVSCSGFATNTSYHWQARVKDVSGSASAWTSFGGNTDPNDADFRVDTTAPSVSSTTPTGGGTGDVSTNITVNFNAGENIDCTTVTNTGSEATSTFYIKKGGTTWVNASVLSCSATQIVLDPTSNLTRFDSYTVYLTTGIQDQAGNAKAALETFVFTATEAAASPNAPSAIGQYKTDGLTAISVGAYTTETGVKFKATMTDQNSVDDIYLEIEVEPVGVAFNNTAGSDASGVSCLPDAPHRYVSPTPVTGEVSCSGFTSGVSYHWQYRVKDADTLATAWTSFGGNTDPNDRDFGVDTTAPSAGIVTPSPQSGTYIATPFSISTTFSDSGSGVASCEYTTNGTTWSAGAVSGTAPNYTCSITGLTCTDGQALTLNMRATDGVGYVGTGASISMTCDAAPPSSPAVSDGTGADIDFTSDTSSLSANWTASTDAKSGLARYDYSIGTGACGSANEANTKTWTNNGTTASMTSSGLTLTSGTTYYVNVKAYDNVGNSTCASSDGITVDTTPPSTGISGNNSGNWTSSDQTITLTPTDASSGVAATKYCVDTLNTCDPVATGTTYTVPFSVTCASGSACTKYIRYYSTDNAGNAETVQSAVSRIDKVKPIDTSPFSISAGVGQCSLSWGIATDTGSGLSATDAYKLVYSTTASPSIDCSDGTEIPAVTTGQSYTHTGLTDGSTYNYRVCAIDAVNNISSGLTGSCTPGDTTPPTVTLDTTLDTATSTSTYVAGTGFNFWAKFSDNESAVTCQYTKDGSNWTAGTVTDEGAGIYKCDAIAVTCTDSTPVTLRMRATSGGGTIESTSVGRTCDASAPTTSAAAGGGYTFDTWTTNTPISITLSAIDGTGSGLASGYPKYCYDSATCSPATSYSVPFNITCSSGTTCTTNVRYQSKDNTGNTETIKTSIVKQDLQTPTDVSFTASVANQTCNLSWSASDAGIGLHTTEAYKLIKALGSTPPADCTGTDLTGNSTATSYNDTGLINGQAYSYRVCAIDAFGWMSAGKTATCVPSEVDLDPPSKVTTLISSSQYARGLYLQWTAPYDEGSIGAGTVASYDFRFIDAVDYPSTLTNNSDNKWDTNWDSTSYWGNGSLLKAAKEPSPVAGNTSQTIYFYCVEGTDNKTCGTTSEGQKSLWPNTLYYFAMKSADERLPAQGGPNYSTVSNITNPTLTTQASHTALHYSYNIIGLPYSATGGVYLNNIFSDDIAPNPVTMMTWDSSTTNCPSSCSDAPGGITYAGTWVTVDASTTSPSPGKGYYLYAYNETSVLDLESSQGIENGNNYVSIPLEMGWNTISNPWLKNVKADGNVWICKGSATSTFSPATGCGGAYGTDYMTLADATAGNWIANGFYYFQSGSDYSYDDYLSAMLRPWWGYRIYMKAGPSDPITFNNNTNNGSYIFVIKKP